jgi:glycerol-3-phosphate dehydrogenase (NAD(P)+)
MKKIAYLGAGTWGFALTSLLAQNGHEVSVWTRNPEFAKLLQQNRIHPKLAKAAPLPPSVRFTSHLSEALEGAELLVESVTTSGIRPVFEQLDQLGPLAIPVVVTSKGIEQKTGFLLPEVISSFVGVGGAPLIGCLSGPSHAEEVVQNIPTSVVCSAYDSTFMMTIQELFSTPTFRIYPNGDLHGVCFGGAMKNIMAIACGIADGLGCGDNTKAALMTRGLHEIRKLCLVKGCRPETLNGLSGMGDLCVTCLSVHSRNYRYGRLIAEGFSPEGARQKIGMAIEGIYTCVAALQLGQQYNIPVPITEATHAIIYEGMHPREAVQMLLQRTVKEEHL